MRFYVCVSLHVCWCELVAGIKDVMQDYPAGRLPAEEEMARRRHGKQQMERWRERQLRRSLKNKVICVAGSEKHLHILLTLEVELKKIKSTPCSQPNL